MKNKALFIPGKRKYLLVACQKGMPQLKKIIDQLIENNISFEFVFTGKKNETDLYQWLGKQKMGAYLYISLPWAEYNAVKAKVDEIGFSEEEYQFIGHGEQTIKVFCCRCHGISIVSTNVTEMSCQHCHLLVEVTDHYSSLRDAYLGFVAKL